jgi:UDP-glucose 4-epimerase
VNILVTGASGFVGVNLVERLLADGHSVIALAASPMPDAAQAAFAALPGKLRSVQADVRDPHALELLFSTAKVEAALAGAAITSSPDRERADPAAIFEVNLAAPLQLVALAARHGVRRVVLPSSSAAMGDRLFGDRPVREEDAPAPATLYGIGKAALEAAAVRWAGLADAGPELVVARLSAVFGPWERATGVRDRLSPPHAIACAAVRREPIAPLPPGGNRDWVYAPFAGEALAWLLTAPRLEHGLYNVGAGVTWHPRELLRAFAGVDLAVAEDGGGRSVDFNDDLSRHRTFLDTRRLAGEFKAPPSPQTATESFARWVREHPQWFRA